ncbi:DUF6634 family protein [Ochrobactrum sp. WV_118_8]
MDIEKLLVEAVTRPSDEVLANAPFLNLWWIIQAGQFLRARGQVEGHPSIDEPYVTTSPVMGFNVDEGWMRTRSRYYRLGSPIDLEKLRLVRAIPIQVADHILEQMRSGLWKEITDEKGKGRLH